MRKPHACMRACYPTDRLKSAVPRRDAEPLSAAATRLPSPRSPPREQLSGEELNPAGAEALGDGWAQDEDNWALEGGACHRKL